MNSISSLSDAVISPPISLDPLMPIKPKDNPPLSDPSQSSAKPDDKVKKNLHPALKKGLKITGALASGALGGYIVYWLTRGLIKIGLIRPGDTKITPGPYVLSGVISASIVQTAQLIYELALKSLGERKDYENLVCTKDTSRADRFRHRVWKVVGSVGKVGRKIDRATSKVLKIRTLKELKDKDIKVSQQCFGEILRGAILQEVRETFSTVLPNTFGDLTVKALGFTILSQVRIPLYIFGFVMGVMDKVRCSYEEKFNEEIALAEKKKAEKAEQDKKAGKLDSDPNLSSAKIKLSFKEKLKKKFYFAKKIFSKKRRASAKVAEPTPVAI